MLRNSDEFWSQTHCDGFFMKFLACIFQLGDVPGGLGISLTTHEAPKHRQTTFFNISSESLSHFSTEFHSKDYILEISCVIKILWVYWEKFCEKYVAR